MIICTLYIRSINDPSPKMYCVLGQPAQNGRRPLVTDRIKPDGARRNAAITGPDRGAVRHTYDGLNYRACRRAIIVSNKF